MENSVFDSWGKVCVVCAMTHAFVYVTTYKQDWLLPNFFVSALERHVYFSPKPDEFVSLLSFYLAFGSFDYGLMRSHYDHIAYRLPARRQNMDLAYTFVARLTEQRMYEEAAYEIILAARELPGFVNDVEYLQWHVDIEGLLEPQSEN